MVRNLVRNEIGWVSLDFTSLGVSLPNVTLGGAPTTGQAIWATSLPSSQPAPAGPAASVPGPLPVLGVAAAFGFSRKLRKRIKLHKGTSAVSTSPGA